MRPVSKLCLVLGLCSVLHTASVAGLVIPQESSHADVLEVDLHYNVSSGTTSSHAHNDLRGKHLGHDLADNQNEEINVHAVKRSFVDRFVAPAYRFLEKRKKKNPHSPGFSPYREFRGPYLDNNPGAPNGPPLSLTTVLTTVEAEESAKTQKTPCPETTTTEPQKSYISVTTTLVAVLTDVSSSKYTTEGVVTVLTTVDPESTPCTTSKAKSTVVKTVTKPSSSSTPDMVTVLTTVDPKSEPCTTIKTVTKPKAKTVVETVTRSKATESPRSTIKVETTLLAVLTDAPSPTPTSEDVVTILTTVDAESSPCTTIITVTRAELPNTPEVLKREAGKSISTVVQTVTIPKKSFITLETVMVGVLTEAAESSASSTPTSGDLVTSLTTVEPSPTRSLDVVIYQSELDRGFFSILDAKSTVVKTVTKPSEPSPTTVININVHNGPYRTRVCEIPGLRGTLARLGYQEEFPDGSTGPCLPSKLGRFGPIYDKIKRWSIPQAISRIFRHGEEPIDESRGVKLSATEANGTTVL